MNDVNAPRERLLKPHRPPNKISGIISRPHRSRVACAGKEDNRASRHREPLGIAQEDIHKVCDRAVFNHENLDTLPLPLHREHWGEILVGKDKEWWVAKTDIKSLNLPVEDRMSIAA